MRESFRLLGEGVREDGYLELCAPCRAPLTIPSFSMAWICAVRDQGRYSGDEELMREFEGQMAEMLRGYLSRRDERGVMVGHADKAYWDFYEWSEGLDGRGPFSEPVVGRVDGAHLGDGRGSSREGSRRSSPR